VGQGDHPDYMPKLLAHYFNKNGRWPGRVVTHKTRNCRWPAPRSISRAGGRKEPDPRKWPRRHPLRVVPGPMIHDPDDARADRKKRYALVDDIVERTAKREPRCSASGPRADGTIPEYQIEMLKTGRMDEDQTKKPFMEPAGPFPRGGVNALEKPADASGEGRLSLRHRMKTPRREKESRESSWRPGRRFGCSAAPTICPGINRAAMS